MSHAYHYISERLYKARRKKSGDVVRTRLAYHQIWFMDDILLLGASERDLKKAMELLTEELHRSLGLAIKPNWQIEVTDYIGPDGKCHKGYLPLKAGDVVWKRSGVLNDSDGNTDPLSADYIVKGVADEGLTVDLFLLQKVVK